jgi:hypothetical protein
MASKNALIVGVGEYEHLSPLVNTVNDAKDIADSLRKLGFAVMLETNPTLTEFEDALENFSTSIQYNKEIALFYYSGHGIQVDGKNYLIPKDAELDRELRIKKQTVSLDEVTQLISEARNHLNIFILDACRDNPFATQYRSANRGLAEVKVMPPSSYIAFAAAGGQTAGDGDSEERNGIFTGAFLKTLEENQGEELDMIFRKTRSLVLKKTRQKQEPWTNHNLADRYYLTDKKTDIIQENKNNIEEDFKNILRAMYSDGSFVESERKLLDKKREELGVSEEKAKLLEEEIRIEFKQEIANSERSKLEEQKQITEKKEKELLEIQKEEEFQKQKALEEKKREEERNANEKEEKLKKEEAESEKKKQELIAKQKEEEFQKQKELEQVNVQKVNTINPQREEILKAEKTNLYKKIMIGILVVIVGILSFWYILNRDKTKIANDSSIKEISSTSNGQTINDTNKPNITLNKDEQKNKEAKTTIITKEKRDQELNQKKSDCEKEGKVWSGSSCVPKETLSQNDSGILIGGLTWDSSSNKSGMTWEAAMSFCQKQGKRLPTLNELQINWKELNDSGYHWTSSEVEKDKSWAFLVILDNGKLANDHKAYHSKSYVRCVR